MPFVTSIAHAAAYNEAGEQLPEDDIELPYEISFEAGFNPADYGITSEPELDDSGNQVPWYTQLQRIPAGTTIYEVYGITNPPDTAERFPKLGLTSDRMKIGEIVL